MAKPSKKNHAQYANKSSPGGAWQQQLAAKIQSVFRSAIQPAESEVFDQLPTTGRGPEDQCRENGQYKYKPEQVRIERQVEQIKRQGVGKNRVLPSVRRCADPP